MQRYIIFRQRIELTAIMWLEKSHHSEYFQGNAMCDVSLIIGSLHNLLVHEIYWKTIELKDEISTTN